MGLQLALEETGCNVTNVNNRTEKHGDDERVIGMDVDLTLTADVGIMKCFALDEEEPPDWGSLLFDGKGVPRPLGIKPIQLTREFEDHRVVFTYISKGKKTTRTVTECKIKKVRIAPEFMRKLDMKLQIQLHPQNEGTAGWLVQMMVNEPTVEISCPQIDAFNGNGNGNGNGGGKGKGKGKGESDDD